MKSMFASAFPVLLLILLVLSPAIAQEVEEAASIPSGISDADYHFLLEQKKKLDSTRDLLVQDIGTFNSDCGKVSSSDVDKVQDCTRREELITARIDSYNRDMVRYQESIQRAQSKSATMVGFEKGTKDSAPVPAPVGLDFVNSKSEAPLVLSREEKSELKDTPAEVQIRLNHYYETLRLRAKAVAASKLGYFLTEQARYEESIPYFKEARAGCADGSDEAKLFDQIISDPRQLEPKPLPGYPVYPNRGAALLDALEYGNGNWDVSYTYLQTARQANPNDLAVRDALNYFEALYAEEKDKDSDGVSLGQIKPRS